MICNWNHKQPVCGQIKRGKGLVIRFVSILFNNIQGEFIQHLPVEDQVKGGWTRPSVQQTRFNMDHWIPWNYYYPSHPYFQVAMCFHLSCHVEVVSVILCNMCFICFLNEIILDEFIIFLNHMSWITIYFYWENLQICVQ